MRMFWVGVRVSNYVKKREIVRVLLIIRSSHVYRRLQVDLKRSKPEAIVAIVVSIVATFCHNSATFLKF